MGLRGRYFSARDLNMINSLNGELMGNIIENLVQIFKICPNETKTNIYGETSSETGKWYFPAIQISALIERAEISDQIEIKIMYLRCVKRCFVNWNFIQKLAM